MTSGLEENDTVINDLITIGEFILDPFNNFNFISLLKTSMFNVKDQELLQYAEHKNTIYWNTAKQLNNFVHIELLEYLFLQKSPYIIYSHLIDKLKTNILSSLGKHKLCIIESFLNQIIKFEEEHGPNLQLFINYIKNKKHENKKIIDKNSLRLMTVHGAKGLQSPIVFIVDTLKTPNKEHTKIIMNQYNIPLLCKNNADDDSSTMLSDNYKTLMKEYNRLLYVALTRAKEELYIMGCGTRIDKGSWYDILTSKKIKHEYIYKEFYIDNMPSKKYTKLIYK